jgi:hypothetical protein
MSDSGSDWGALIEDETLAGHMLGPIPSKEDVVNMVVSAIFVSALAVVPAALAKMIAVFQKMQLKKNAGEVARRRGEEAELWELAVGEPWDPDKPAVAPAEAAVANPVDQVLVDIENV